jgi:hypothetical protein
LGEEVAEGLVLLVRSDLEGRLVPLDLRAMPVILAQREIRVFEDLPVLREMLANVALPDQKDLGVFKVPPGPLVVELEEPRFLDQKALGVPLVLPDPRAIKASKVLLDPLVLPEQMGNQGLRVIMARLVPLDLLDHRALQESAVPPVRMQSRLSLTTTSPRLRLLRLMARRRMSKTHSDRPTPSRTELGTTLR